MPPPILTPRLLTTLRSTQNLPSQTWHYTTAVTLSALNRPHELPTLLHAALADHGPLPPASTPSSTSAAFEATSPHYPQHLHTTRLIREALLKSTAILGLPLTINSLLALGRATPPHLQDAPMTPSPTARAVELATTPSSSILHRGSQFFSRTYGKVAARVMGQMDRCGTEDLGLTARLMYGYLLSNTGVLGPRETSFCLVAGLVPLDVNAQLKGHLRGAVNNGARVEEVRAVRGIAMAVCEAAGMRRLEEGERTGMRGWREDVADI